MVKGWLGDARLVADLLHAGGIVAKGGKKHQRVFENGLTVIHSLTIPHGIVNCQAQCKRALKLTVVSITRRGEGKKRQRVSFMSDWNRIGIINTNVTD